jgi:peptidoglycan/LPS O-acetylase OafA/YrhL
MKTLGDLASRRNNNFNLIRMLAATAVLISHSYPLALGSNAVEPLFSWLGISLGELAVITFFCVSGFFISLSRDRAPGNLDFFSARFLRIYPGLTLVLLISVFVIGPIFTTLSTSEYLSSREIYSDLSNNLTLFNMNFISPITMTLLTFPIVLIVAVCSWHFIEKPAMSRRHAFSARLNARLDALKAYRAGTRKGTA